MSDHTKREKKCRHGVSFSLNHNCPRCEIVWRQQAVNQFEYMLKIHKTALTKAQQALQEAGEPQ